MLKINCFVVFLIFLLSLFAFSYNENKSKFYISKINRNENLINQIFQKVTRNTQSNYFFLSGELQHWNYCDLETLFNNTTLRNENDESLSVTIFHKNKSNMVLDYDINHTSQKTQKIFINDLIENTHVLAKQVFFKTINKNIKYLKKPLLILNCTENLINGLSTVNFTFTNSNAINNYTNIRKLPFIHDKYSINPVFFSASPYDIYKISK